MKTVMAIDQGTTGTTVMIIDSELRVVGRQTVDFPQIFPQPGWVEHDPAEIWRSVEQAASGALADAKLTGDDIAAVGITNQRETTVLWNRGDLTPVHNAIVWQDRRTADICTRLKDAGLEQRFRDRTGLVLDPYFSGTKLTWLFENNPAMVKRATMSELAFGTIDSFLVAKLTKGAVHVTDVSNASRTLLCRIDSLAWDDELLDALRVPREILPTIRSSSEVYGETRGVSFLPDGVPIAGIAGDQQAALFGQACYQIGDAKSTYGTGAFILMNTGEKPVPSNSGLLTTVAWRLGDGAVSYALEGSAFIAGAAVQWLRDGLGLIGDAQEIEALAASVDSSQGVVFVPALTGLGAPHWRPDARGLISGLTRGTTKAHVARATLEGIALQVADLLQAMESDSGVNLRELKVDGGASANGLLMQFQADLLGVEIARPEVIETTALGAAFLAGLAVGVWADQSACSDAWRQAARFSPGERDYAASVYANWSRAVAKT